MSAERTLEPGQIVYLVAELRADGLIHEIGSRAVVLEVTVSGVVLELGGAPSAVACAARHVEPAAERRLRARRPAGAVTRLRRAAA
jgi:hypothetical protein